jgi:hypothetical protein
MYGPHRSGASDVTLLTVTVLDPSELGIAANLSDKEEAVAQKTEDKEGNAERESPRQSGPAVSRRTIKRDEDTSQLLERGETPTEEELVDESVDSPSEITSEGGPGMDASYRFDAPDRETGDSPTERVPGSSVQGGYSTLGGGVYPDEGNEDDTPHYGDWNRHSSGASSGARGQEGLSFPGEHTWGEGQDEAERTEERG